MREKANALQREIERTAPFEAQAIQTRQEAALLRGRLEMVEAARTEMTRVFESASARALEQSSQQFLRLAQQRFDTLQSEASGSLGTLVQPVRDTLGKLEKQVRDVELKREGAYAALTGQLQALQREASKLATALSSPTARGRWGEVQLRRVIELAGMVEYCDFLEQNNLPNTRLRPDLQVQLPNGRTIVVDSKVPMRAFLEACESNEETTRKTKMVEHARQIREHLKSLATKQYSQQLDNSPEFVVAFLPGEVFLSAALEADPELIEYGAENNVILATPTTLIALLRAVAYGWNQERIAQSAMEIRDLGRKLFDQVGKFADTYDRVGKGLHAAFDAYEKGLGALDTTILRTARRLGESGIVASGEIKDPRSLAQLSLGVDDESGGDSGGSGETAMPRGA
jgi:DNA recombination protein RmuC